MRRPDFENSGSGLTRRQRSLAIVVILLLSYIALGSLIHSLLNDLNFIDAMYFSLVSIETIGFGDIKPVTTGARIFTCIYAAFGIITIVLAVGLMRETVLEALEVGYRKRVQMVRQRRKIGRWRKRVTTRWREAVEWRLRESGKPVWVRDERRPSRGIRGMLSEVFEGILPWVGERNSSGFMTGYHPHGMHLNLEALSWRQLEASAMEAGVPLNTLLPEGFKLPREDSDNGSSHEHEANHDAAVPVTVQPDAELPLTHARLGRMIALIGAFAFAVDKSSHLRGDKPGIPAREPPAQVPPQFKKSLTLQYDALRSGMEKEEAKAFYARLVVVWVLFLVFWIVGGLIFMKTEGWSPGVSLYFCFVAFTTIGYGDYSPSTPAGRSIFVAWALLGVATMTILISVIAEAFSSKYHTALHTGVFNRAVKRYRERARVIAEKTRRAGRGKVLPPSPIHPSNSDEQTREEALKLVNTQTQTQLEALPHKILSDAKMFHEHLSYFVSAGKTSAGDELPPGLQQLMNEITGAEKIGERIKREILQDEDARHTLFTLSIEQALRKMINSAESALQALEERERLIALHDVQNSASASSSSQEANTDDADVTPAAPPAVVVDEVQRPPQVQRVSGVKYARYDTMTSYASSYSDWR